MARANGPPIIFDSLPARSRRRPGKPHRSDVLPGRTSSRRKYHDSFLICDWSQGRILAVFLKRAGASYSAESTELVTRPAAQLHRHRGRPGGIGLLHDRRPRHAGGPFPGDLDGRRKPGSGNGSLATGANAGDSGASNGLAGPERSADASSAARELHSATPGSRYAGSRPGSGNSCWTLTMVTAPRLNSTSRGSVRSTCSVSSARRRATSCF